MLSPEWTPAALTSTFARTRQDDREGGVHRLPPGPPGPGRAHVDTLKNHRARTVPLVAALVPIIDRWTMPSPRRPGPLADS
jgi:hypothetical protein